MNNREALQVILDKPHYATELTERTPEAVQAFREAMDGFVQRGAFEVAVFTGAIGSAGEAMKSLETFLNEQPTARYGLQLGLGNDVSLGQIVSDAWRRWNVMTRRCSGALSTETQIQGDLCGHAIRTPCSGAGCAALCTSMERAMQVKGSSNP